MLGNLLGRPKDVTLAALIGMDELKGYARIEWW